MIRWLSGVCMEVLWNGEFRGYRVTCIFNFVFEVLIHVSLIMCLFVYLSVQLSMWLQLITPPEVEPEAVVFDVVALIDGGENVPVIQVLTSQGCEEVIDTESLRRLIPPEHQQSVTAFLMDHLDIRIEGTKRGTTVTVVRHYWWFKR